MGNLHNGSANRQHGLPLIPVQGQDCEQALQEGDVKNGEVKDHRQGDGVDQHGVVVQEESQQRLARRQGVHRVQHLNNDQDRQRDRRGRLGHIVAEHLATNLRE